jgi:hypothetical protein
VSGLNIAPGFKLPLEAVTETFAILAKRGSGKTYTANVMAEEMIGAGHPVVVIDPIGVWWGLRSSADGKKAGLPIAIFGGDHADVPLDENAGEIIADAIISERFSAIIDLSLLSKSASRRFMTKFIETLYHRNRDPLHVFVDEADAFAPQRGVAADAARLLGAMEDLVRRGRARGIGVTLITQRPAVLHKDVLTQAEVLVCLRMNGVRDVQAIDEWVRLHADEGEAAELKKSLPSLPIGTAWIWSPGWLGILERVRVRTRTTFDSSATPKIGEQRIVPKQLADIDIDALGQKITATAEQAKANDPKALKARIRELERAAANVETPEPVVERVEAPVISDEQLVKVTTVMKELTGLVHEISTAISPTLHAAAEAPPTPARTPVKAPQPRRTTPTAPPRPPATPPADGPLPKAQAAILGTLIRHGPSTQIQVALLTGYSSKSGGFRNSISALRTAGLIEGTKERLEATEAGVAAAGDIPPLPTGQALIDHWRAQLGKAERAIFDVLLDVYPGQLDHEQVAEATGYSAVSGGFRNSISRLRTLRLINGGRDGMAVADEIGGEAA